MSYDQKHTSDTWARRFWRCTHQWAFRMTGEWRCLQCRAAVDRPFVQVWAAENGVGVDYARDALVRLQALKDQKVKA